MRTAEDSAGIYYVRSTPTGAGSTGMFTASTTPSSAWENSFTHLFDERDRRKTLAEFYAMLSHDGVLILDQRNYDAILDHGYSSKHRYYYCGEKVRVEPEHVDEGLARFRYDFPDEAVYHLNMYPLRKEYTRRLMHEVGFQRIETYGDFQETYRDDEPDFFVHFAEKLYVTDEREG